MINISYLNVPLDYYSNSGDTRLKNNMHLTAQPLYENKDIPFENLFRIFKSDYRQYTPFTYANNIKKSENWSNEKQNILILDVDDGLTILEAKKIFEKYEYWICTTKSHQVDKKGVKCDRFRVILKAINIPVGDEYFNYMRQLELLFPFIDTQVNTKTGAFLGASNCDYWYNKGISFDFNIIKPTLKKEAKKPIVKTFPKRTTHNDLEVDKIRSFINRELCRTIIEALGYAVNNKFMFKMRENERTASASISNTDYPLIKDFGGDFEGDIIDFVMVVKGCDFKTSLEYIKNFI